GATLTHQFGNASLPETVRLALATICCYCQGAAAPITIGDVITRAQQLLLQEGRSHRTQAIRKSPDDIEAFAQRITQGADGNDLKGIATSTIDAFHHIRNEMNASIASHNVLAEELDILWWAFGGYSSYLKKPYSECNASVAALISGRELADRTTSQLGTLSA